ncbi:Hsp70 family protein [Chamaesiphon sp. VAR_48_metabat_403]|uniref:Hsp70 family protein n=1 Tax=Chamaesiphon sp. VAR_48_metabat_403 TaxID=2964700 RepID=UPI00286E091E|nr:Hsp70 family protein [Chamaesiphon sp. VAR_48_metabat_403]
MGSVVGIDLGTTNSVAAFRFGDLLLVTAADNKLPDRYLTPSIVAWQGGKLVAGQAAQNQLRAEPHHVITTIKRLMGRGIGDPTVQVQIQDCAYQIGASSHGTENSLVVRLADREFAPEEIAAEILKKVIANADLFQQEQGQTGKITEAVITVPAYFNDRQRHATTMAAIAAGIKPRELLAEPTAAAISYGFEPGSDREVKTILVYDFGGGTFDASLITASGNWFAELGKAGDLWLGGENIDRQLVDWAIEQMAIKEELPDLRKIIASMSDDLQMRFWVDLKLAVERAKIALSSAPTVRIIPATPLFDSIGMPIYLDVELTVAVFNELLMPYLLKTIDICHEAIKCADYSIDLVDAVLLVGGSAQIPLVREHLTSVFGADRVVVHPRPMYAIAEGAAIVAAGLTEKVCTVSRDYYIRLTSGLEKVIARGDTLPFSGMYTFRTISDEQRLVNIAFFNRDDSSQQDELVGDLWLSLPKSYPTGTEVTVALELDEQTSSLQVSAFLRQDPSVRGSCTFSRGRSDEQLYRQIAEIIEESNQQNLDRAEIQELNRQIAPIVETANQTIDPRTGQERLDLFKKAQAAIAKLRRDSATDRRSAENWANYCDYLVSVYSFLMPPAQIDRLKALSLKLRDALHRNDSSQMEATCEAAAQENQSLPEWLQRIRYCEVATYNIRQLKPTQVAIMEAQKEQLIAALRAEDIPTAEQIWYGLQIEANQWIDRAAPAGTIEWGLQR